ncbi:MAG: DUF2177 family protein [Pseudomonadota bacterium]
MSVLDYVILYAACLLPFIVVDAIWLTFVTAPEFRKNIGEIMLEAPRWSAAVAFYALFGVGLVFFAAAPGVTQGLSLFEVALRGAMLGLMAYGTYELTNLSTLKGWTWHMVILDAGWGTALSGAAAVVGVVIATRLGVSV